MGDLKLTQVPTLTDFDYMLLVKGDQVAKMEKATLATVVAGLFSSGLQSNFNIDTVSTLKWCRVQGSTAISNSEFPFGSDWFFFINIPINSDNAIQFAINQTASVSKARTKWDGSYRTWNTI